MLEELQVQGFGLVGEARIELPSGLVVFTGETGAGKTMLLGSVLSLLGARGDPPPGPWEEATVEGRFVLEGEVARKVEAALGLELGGEELVVSRVFKGGRSKARVNGRLVPISSLSILGSLLAEVQAQNAHLGLGSPRKVRDLLDRMGGDSHQAALEEVAEGWRSLQAIRAEARELGGDGALEREADMLRYQIAEIEGARLRAGEDEEIAREVQRLENAVLLREAVGHAAELLGEGAIEAVAEGVRSVREATSRDPSLGPLLSRLESVRIELADIASELGAYLAELDAEPDRLEELRARLAQIRALERKYGRGVEAILAYLSRARERLAWIEGRRERLCFLEEEEKRVRGAYAEAAARLSASRRGLASRLQFEATQNLRELGLREARLEVAITPGPEDEGGYDRVELLFSSHPDLPPSPLAKAASGGELSRTALAVRAALAGAADVPLLVLDEVDAGIGGRAAVAVGRTLSSLATRHQILCVTHLPQIAAFADGHFRVERDGASVRVEPVEGEERLRELSRMLAGLPESGAGKAHAEELLEVAERAKARRGSA